MNTYVIYNDLCGHRRIQIKNKALLVKFVQAHVMLVIIILGRLRALSEKHGCY